MSHNALSGASEKAKIKRFVDKEVQCELTLSTQCHIPTTPTCECRDVRFMSSNDRYNTDFYVKGSVHDVSIGQTFKGEAPCPDLENSRLRSGFKDTTDDEKSSLKSKQIPVTGHYQTKIHITRPQNTSFTFEIQSQNYSPTFQLDPSATNKILLSNPGILLKALGLHEELSLPQFETADDKRNLINDVKNNQYPDEFDEISISNRGYNTPASTFNEKKSKTLNSIYLINSAFSSYTSLMICPGVNTKIKLVNILEVNI